MFNELGGGGKGNGEKLALDRVLGGGYEEKCIKRQQNIMSSKSIVLTLCQVLF